MLMTDAITVSLTPKQRALMAANAVQPDATGLVEFRSEGRLVIIGEPRSVCAAVELLNGDLSIHCIFIARPDQVLELKRATSDTIARDDLILNGYLGAFTLSHESGEQSPLARYDLVLDLCESPLFQMARKPLGYFAPGTDSRALADALQALPDLIGRFEKPQFFAYDPGICAHGASGIEGCRRCIDACPADAIISTGEKVEVNPKLCQGGGICTSVCPSGAMTYRYPTASDALSRIRTLISTFLEFDKKRPTLVFHGRNTTLPDLGNDEIPVQLEELASAGIDTWLTALCYGACAIRLLDDCSEVPDTRRELEHQRAIATGILQGLDYPPVITWYDARRESGVMPALPTAGFTSAAGKRQTLFMAIDHLAEHSPVKRRESSLPSGAPLGQIVVDQHACTLCLACTSVCPSQALADGGDKPALRFFEGNCVQCGVCAKACPEQAISLSTRVLYDPEERRRAVTLHEEEPFCCVACGKPFATRAVIAKMQDRLSDHYMFQDAAAKQRLQMCDKCRVADLVRSGVLDDIV